MPLTHWGPGSASQRPVTTFTGSVVQSIAADACPTLNLVADPCEAAVHMNELAQGLLLSLRGETKPSEAEAWAKDLAAASAALVRAVGFPPARTGMRIGLSGDDLRQLGETMKLVRRIRGRALWYAGEAANAKATTTAAKPVAEDRWLMQMAGVFEFCFATPLRISKDPASGERRSPCAHFIAAAAVLLAGRLEADAPTWRASMRRFSDPKTVAGRLELIRPKHTRRGQAIGKKPKKAQSSATPYLP